MRTTVWKVGAVADGVDGAEPTGWVVVLPVKPLRLAKSRLAHPRRAALALAMATDTVAAARRAGPEVAAVVVVTDDPDARDLLTDAGAFVVADRPDAGLNPALTHGAEVAAEGWPGRGIAALSADLAALRPDHLRRALAAAAHHDRAVVADAQGTGTVLLTARAGVRLQPAFGPGSRQAHTATGARDLTGSLGGHVAGLRRDVDTVADLTEALALGAGPATLEVLRGPTRAALTAADGPTCPAG